MIHPDSNHPSKMLSKQVDVSILTEDGIEYETVQFQHIQWNTADVEKDTVIIASEGNGPKIAIYSTMKIIQLRQSSFELHGSEYGQSILALMRLAKGDTDGSKSAAQVLLSAYSGHYFQLSIPSLCYLDEDNYRHAMTVIYGRKATFQEPHNLIENGDDQFLDLWNQWKGVLHVQERFKSMCSTCYGTGKQADDEGEPTSADCRNCDGHGSFLPNGLEYTAK